MHYQSIKILKDDPSNCITNDTHQMIIKTVEEYLKKRCFLIQCPNILTPQRSIKKKI